MGQQRKGLDIIGPVSSLPPQSRGEPEQGLTVLLEKCIPAGFLKLQATAQLFVITNVPKQTFLGFERTCLLQKQRFWKKKREGRTKEKATVSWISSFPSGFQAPESLPNKMSTFFPCSLTFDAYCTASFSAHRGFGRLKSQGFYSGLMHNLNHGPERREGKGGKRLLAQSCLFSALHV